MNSDERAERAAIDAELAARKAASDAEWRTAHGWPDPNPPDRIPDEWNPRTYICPDCLEAVVWTTIDREGRTVPTADAGKWRHAACIAAKSAKNGRIAPRPVELP